MKMTRRQLLAGTSAVLVRAAQNRPAGFTEFQIATMTLGWAQFPFERALQGIAAAGYRYVAWGPNHSETGGKPQQLLLPRAPAAQARQLAARCADRGLQPVMMFAVTYLESPEAIDDYKGRIEQAAAAKIPYILSFGNPKAPPDAREKWVRNLRVLAPLARAAGVTIAIKQHGGVSAIGRQCAEIVREVGDEGLRMFYDAGNTRFYANEDPLADIASCAEYVRGFAIKDYRETPKRTICAPGLGEIDHFKLLGSVARTGLRIPLACETLFDPYLPRPATPEAVDALARRAREFLETVTAGLRAAG